MDKNLLSRMAKTLHQNKVTIHNYNFDEAMEVLIKNDYSQSELDIFENNAFHVYLELMRIETIQNMHNSIYPNIKN